MQISVTVNSNTGNVAEIVSQTVQKVFSQVKSRGPRAANELRNAELNVLSGQGGGRVYGNHQASAPGSPPSVRSGTLRRSFRPVVEGGGGGAGVSIRPAIISATKYAPYLEDGTRKMAPRPFRDKIVETAEPKIIAIYSEPYL